MTRMNTVATIFFSTAALVAASANAVTSSLSAAAASATTAKAVTTNSGLKYIDLKVGKGEEAKKGMLVLVNYNAWLENGTKFDSSYDRREPFSFKLGAGQVIQGWEEGVEGMRVGGKRKLIIPPDLAYGDQGAGDRIPPKSTLVFEVELLQVQ